MDDARSARRSRDGRHVGSTADGHHGGPRARAGRGRRRRRPPGASRACSRRGRGGSCERGIGPGSLLRRRARTAARDGRESREPSLEGESGAIELLAATVSWRLASPLAVASVNLEVLEAAMAAITRLADTYARNAAAGQALPDSEVQRVVALRASAPATPALQATVQDLGAALREASSAVANVYALVATEIDAAADVMITITQFGQLVRPVVERVADLIVELPTTGEVRVAMARSALMQTLASLLTNALHSMRDRRDRGAIGIRVEVRGTVALIEVVDNGAGMSPIVLANATDPHAPRRRSGPAAALAQAADQIRRAGGELVLESELGNGTTAKVFVPLAVQPQPRPPSAN